MWIHIHIVYMIPVERALRLPPMILLDAISKLQTLYVYIYIYHSHTLHIMCRYIYFYVYVCGYTHMFYMIVGHSGHATYHSTRCYFWGARSIRAACARLAAGAIGQRRDCHDVDTPHRSWGDRAVCAYCNVHWAEPIDRCVCKYMYICVGGCVYMYI